ncbi:hypothetical protein [uncultured Aliiroseovarius sp.]|nr:hypothetical protein [uncultured Aliiroseovarius sp.]
MNLFFRRTQVRHRRHLPRGATRDLSPHMMRDIGLETWPEHPRDHIRRLW